MDPARRVCVCASGSVAVVKLPQIVRKLTERDVCVDVVLTASAERLLQSEYEGKVPADELVQLADRGGGRVKLWRDSDEWDSFNSVGDDSVLHIELAKRSQVLLIAPLSANTLASIALGLCGNLLTSTVRAWYYNLQPSFVEPLYKKFGRFALEKPTIVAPSMNTYMWYQSITEQHMQTLRTRRVHVIEPVEKLLACGDFGKGAMAGVDDIVSETIKQLDEYKQAAAEAKEQGRPLFSSSL